MADLQSKIETLWEGRDSLAVQDPEVRATVQEAIDRLDRGEVRVATLTETGEVEVHQWLKQAILLLFRLNEISTTEAGPFEYADKLPLKRNYHAQGVRVVPGGAARYGAHLEPGVILMPSFVSDGLSTRNGSRPVTFLPKR